MQATEFRRLWAAKQGDLRLRPSVPLYSGITIDGPDSLAEVLRLLDSLSDMAPREKLAGITRLRIRQAMEKPKTQERGRIMP